MVYAAFGWTDEAPSPVYWLTGWIVLQPGNGSLVASTLSAWRAMGRDIVLLPEADLCLYREVEVKERQMNLDLKGYGE